MHHSLALPGVSRHTLSIPAALLLAASPGSASASEEAAWPSFRGPGARGIAEGFATPVEWDVDTEENVLWRVDLPGLAHSSPVVWGDRVFVTTAEGTGESELKVGLYGAGEPVGDEGEQAFLVLCLDRRTGDVLWEEVAHEGVPRIQRHPKSTHANSTPAVDARHLVAFFGSEGLYCFDHEGTRLWKKDLGVLNCGAPELPDYQWGFASSPVLHDGRVLVQCDIHGESFLACFDAATGEEIWRTPRDEGPTWCTPTVDVRPERAQVIANGYRHSGGYDLATGKELWKIVGGGDVPVPTPVVAHDLVFLTSAHGRMAPIYAVRPGATGTVTAEEGDPGMAWSYPSRGNYMQTPLVYGDEAYFLSDNGVLACYDAATGAAHYRERLGDGTTGFSASGVAADGKLYFTSEEGEVYVLKPGTRLEVLAVNTLEEVCMATPAISRGVLYFRTRSHLVAVGTEPDR